MPGMTLTAVYVNGESLTRLTQAVLIIESNDRVEWTNLPQPDRGWEFIDAAGHWHAYDDDGKLPTLHGTSEHRECDGSCGGVCEGEGYHVTVYTCRICGEVVTPGTTPGPHSFVVPGLRTWRIEMEGLDWPAHLDGQTVSVRVDYDGGIAFGVAAWRVDSFEADGHTSRVRSSLVGLGPLGIRKGSRRPATPAVGGPPKEQE